ncbi:MAG: hypothetical protein KDK33_15445 [Leptospiraceae bacterium]|nr:hypothetical protein [Leptospiraceae bacterium]
MQEGLWKRFFDNGTLWDQGKYLAGKKTGPWKVYSKDGNLKQEKDFGPPRK